MLDLLTGGKATLAAAAVAGLAVMAALFYRGQSIERGAEVAQLAEARRMDAVAMAELRSERAAAITALEREANAIAARAASLATIRRAVDAAPTTTACLDSPAIRAGLAGLRERAASRAGGPPATAGPAAVVPRQSAATGNADRR